MLCALLIVWENDPCRIGAQLQTQVISVHRPCYWNRLSYLKSHEKSPSWVLGMPLGLIRLAVIKFTFYSSAN